MTDEREASEDLGSGCDPVAWSWRYLRHPGVLVPWLAGAALSALLRDRTPAHERSAGSAPAVTPAQPAVLRVHPRADAARRAARDDEARAA
jgi:hypothetical protein